MGFRNPPSSASAVDTRGKAASGVVVYQRTFLDAGGVTRDQGVIEWNDGNPDHAPVTATLTPDPSGSSKFELFGPTGAGLPAAAVLRLTEDTVQATAQLQGDVINLDASTVNVGPNRRPLLGAKAWTLPRSAHTINASDTFGAGSFVGLVDQTVTGAPAGDYLVRGLLLMSAGAAAGGNAQLLVNTVDALGSPRTDLTTTVLPTVLDHLITGHPGGDLRIQLLYRLSVGTATIFTAGSGARLAYLGPRS
jgi:hypothetical protein